MRIHAPSLPSKKLAGQFGCDLTDEKALIKELTIQVLSERQEREEAEASRQPAGDGEASVKVEGALGLVPSDDESRDDSSSSSDSEEERKVKKKIAGRKKEKSRGEEKKKGGGFNKEYAWSEEMAAFLGEGYMSRPQVTKRMWEYIKTQGLQKPEDRRVILCDERLQRLFSVPSLNMFKLPVMINKHMRQDDREEGADEGREKQEGGEVGKKERASTKPRNPKRKKTGEAGTPAKRGGFPPEKISVQLQGLMGKATASRNEVVKEIWTHVKSHNLQDPAVSVREPSLPRALQPSLSSLASSLRVLTALLRLPTLHVRQNRMMISCDATLKGILGVDACHGFGISKLLTPHFLGRA